MQRQFTIINKNAWRKNMKNEKEIREYALSASEWLYVWGANGEKITPELMEKLYKNYGSASYPKAYYKNKLKIGQGKMAADCSGFLCPLSGYDDTAQGYYKSCSQKGTITNIPEDKVVLVFKQNNAGRMYHVGIYLGDGTVAEMASSTLNYQHKKLLGGGWTHWGKPKWILYTRNRVGWQQEDGGWRFYLDNDHCVVNDWYEDKGKWYWFDGAGIMVRNIWYRYNGYWYYLGADGAMVKGQQTIDGKWYIMDDEGRMMTEPVTLTPDADGVLRWPGMAK